MILADPASKYFKHALAGLGFSLAAAFSASAMAGQATYLPTADVEIRADLPTVNFGTATTIGLDGSPARSALFRFTVTVPSGEAVKKATLRLFMTSASSADVFVRQVTSTSWSESTTTYQNAPAIGTQVAASGPVATNSYVSLDVTPLVSSGGAVSMAVTRNNSVALGSHSRQAASNPPQLIVETAATSTPSAGAAPIGSTQYAIPSGAVFVSKSGSDSAAGTLSAPVKTIQRAINIAPSGRTIVVRQGNYHESIKIPSNRTFTIQSYPGEAVWLDGSSAVTGWVKSGTTWVKSGWTAAFDSTPGFNAGSPDSRFINPDYPMASHPDQVWVDGARLAQVSSAAKVVPGTFYVDYAADKLIIGTDPTGHTVTASDLSEGVNISGANSKLLGIGIRKYATPTTAVATVKIGATGVTLENVVVSDNANVGIIVARGSARLNKITAQRNGLVGVAGNEADNIVVSSLYANDNNVENYNMSPVSGGMKITRTRGITIRDSVFTANIGNGLWIDESSYNSKIVNNQMINNRRNGMSYEISSLAVVADNVFTGNGGIGIKINDATNVRIYNNTIGNNDRNMEIVQDTRRATNMSIPGHDLRQPQPDPTVTWLLGNVDIMNNLVTPAKGQYATYIRDYSGERSCAQMDIQLNGNQFNPQSPGYLMVWGITATQPAVYSTVAQFKTGAKQGSGNGDSAANTVPVGLPADIATLVGQAEGTKFIGAFP